MREKKKGEWGEKGRDGKSLRVQETQMERERQRERGSVSQSVPE